MEYMESKMQDQYDGFDDMIRELDPFIDDLISICNKHSIIDDGDLNFVRGLFDKKYLPPLEHSNKGTSR